MVSIRILTAAIALAFASTAAMDMAHSQEKTVKAQKQRKKASGGLASSEGDVKRKVMFPMDTSGPCQNHYRRYVAAGGHSAYAATPIDYFYGGAFACASAVNAASKAAAEKRAMADCQLAIKQTLARTTSHKFNGPCLVHASK